jgi:hypothetical protein
VVTLPQKPRKILLVLHLLLLVAGKTTDAATRHPGVRHDRPPSLLRIFKFLGS